MQTMRSSGLVAIQFLKHEKRMVNLKRLTLQNLSPHDNRPEWHAKWLIFSYRSLYSRILLLGFRMNNARPPTPACLPRAPRRPVGEHGDRLNILWLLWPGILTKARIRFSGSVYYAVSNRIWFVGYIFKFTAPSQTG